MQVIASNNCSERWVHSTRDSTQRSPIVLGSHEQLSLAPEVVKQLLSLTSSEEGLLAQRWKYSKPSHARIMEKCHLLFLEIDRNLCIFIAITIYITRFIHLPKKIHCPPRPFITALNLTISTQKRMADARNPRISSLYFILCVLGTRYFGITWINSTEIKVRKVGPAMRVFQGQLEENHKIIEAFHHSVHLLFIKVVS